MKKFKISKITLKEMIINHLESEELLDNELQEFKNALHWEFSVVFNLDEDGNDHLHIKYTNEESDLPITKTKFLNLEVR